MEPQSPDDVLALMRSRSQRVRTGLWLMSAGCFGNELEEAVRLQIQAVDIRQRWLDGLPQGVRFANLGADRLVELLNQIAAEAGSYDCALVYNLDLLLAGLSYTDRQKIWQSLFHGFPHRSRALLVAMPRGAQNLLPPAESLEQWSREKRLAAD